MQLLQHRHRPIWLLLTILVIILALTLSNAVQKVKSNSILPPAKQALLQRVYQIPHLTRLTGMAPKHPNYVPPVVTPEPWPSGIFASGQAPLPSGLYSMTNLWQGVLNDEHVQVYAGSKTTDPSQGLVIVLTTSFDLRRSASELFETPSKRGALHIMVVRGTRLYLVSADGTPFVFDISIRRFVSS